MKSRLIFFALLIIGISWICSCKKDRQEPTLSTTPVPICYSYKDTTDCLDSAEFASVLLGSWTLTDSVQQITETFTFLAEKNVSPNFYWKGILSKTGGNQVIFSWNIGSPCPYRGGLNLISPYPDSSSQIIVMDAKIVPIYNFIEYCQNDFFSVWNGAYIFKKIK